MHVLNVNHTLDPVTGGGTAERTAQMSRFLTRSGIRCTVLTTTAGMADARGERAADFSVVTVPLLWQRFFVPRISRRALSRLVAGADVVHLMGHWSVLNAFAYWAARRMRKPYVVCPAGALPIYGRSRLVKRIYNLLVGTRLVRNANAHIAITSDEVRHFEEYGVDKSKVCIIPNGVNADDFAYAAPAAFRTKFGLGAHSFALFMGRLNSIKGPDLLLRAFCGLKDALPDLHLVFAGSDGGMLEGLRDLASAEGVVGRVHFIGYVGSVDKASAYRASTLLAIPSRQEAMSIVALEAAISETPVLLTDQCGFDELAQYGAKVVPATTDGIREGLAEMLMKPELLAAKGKSLSTYTRKHYLWESVVQAYARLYEQLLRSPIR